MRRTVALVLSMTLATAGCAARAQGPRVSTPPTGQAPIHTTDPDLMASYVRQLAPGSRVRVTLADGRVVHGTLMKADADPIVVQRRTRIPEPPLQIPIRDLQAVELESKNGSPARAIAVGAAAGAASALGVLLILAAIFAD